MRSWTVCLGLSAIWAASVASPLTAQVTEREWQTVPRGSHVRVLIGGSARVRGSYWGLVPGELVASKGPVTYLELIPSCQAYIRWSCRPQPVKIKVDMSEVTAAWRRDHAGREGAIVGGLLFGVAGAALGYVAAGLDDSANPANPVATAVLLGASSVAIGAALGWFTGESISKWRPVSLGRPRIDSGYDRPLTTHRTLMLPLCGEKIRIRARVTAVVP